MDDIIREVDTIASEDDVYMTKPESELMQKLYEVQIELSKKISILEQKISNLTEKYDKQDTILNKLTDSNENLILKYIQHSDENKAKLETAFSDKLENYRKMIFDKYSNFDAVVETKILDVRKDVDTKVRDFNEWVTSNFNKLEKSINNMKETVDEINTRTERNIKSILGGVGKQVLSILIAAIMAIILVHLGIQ